MSSCSCKLSVLLQDYLGIRPDLSEIHRYGTKRAVDKFIDLAGDIPISEINFESLNIYKAYLIELKYAAKSVNNIFKALSPVFSWAMSMGYMQVNPCHAVKKLKEMPRPATILAGDEFNRLVKVDEDLRQQSLMYCGIESLRRSESLNLTWGEIDFDKKYIHLERKIASDVSWPWQTKNRQRRYIPLIQPHIDVLIKLRQILPNNQPYVNLTTQRWKRMLEKQRLGILKERERICPDNNFNRKYKKLRESADVKALYHDLRKTGLTKMNRNCSLTEVQNIAGHADPKTTSIYLGIEPLYLGRAKEVLEATI
jgi:integrase